MYLERVGLKEKPFEQTPDSRFLYASDQHANALSSIKFAIAIRDPFVIITGEIGSGQTTILNRVLGELEADVVAARVTHIGGDYDQAFAPGMDEIAIGKPRLVFVCPRPVSSSGRTLKFPSRPR